MTYNSEKVIGDAGEHFFTYWIIHNFQYPCRLLDKDLGLDAKIEIVDDNQKTTGEFIFVQIKSSSSTKIKHKVKLRHFLYWESISIPVILVGIDLSTNNIYWLHINDDKVLVKYKTRAIKSKNENTVINIYRDGKKLESQDKGIFEILRFKHIIPEFEDSADCLKNATNSLINTYGNVIDYKTFADAVSNSMGYYDAVSDYILNVDWLIIHTKKMEYISKEYSDIINHLNGYTKDQIDDIVEQKTNQALAIIDNINNYMKEYIQDPYATTEDKKEVLIQLSNYGSLQSQEAQNLVNLVQGTF